MAHRLTAKTVLSGLAAVPFLWMACGSRKPGVTASSGNVPRTYLLALLAGAGGWSVRVSEVGQDPLLAADGREVALPPMMGSLRGPFVDAPRRLVYFVQREYDRGDHRLALLAYRLDQPTGDLTLFGRVPLAQGGFGDVDPAGAVDPGGRFLYTTDSGSVHGYRIDTNAGLRVEPIPGSPFTTPSVHGYPIAGGFTFSPSGRFVWVHAVQGSGPYGYPRRTEEAVLSFRVGPESGALELTGSLNVKVYDGMRSNLAVDPRERFTFLGAIERWRGLSLSTYGIDPESGALAEVGKLREFFADRLHMTPSGRWLLAANDGGELDTLEIQPQGDLVLRNSLHLDAGAFAQHGPYVYVSLSWPTPDGLAILRLDEGSGALEIVRDLPFPNRTIRSLVVADLPAD